MSPSASLTIQAHHVQQELHKTSTDDTDLEIAMAPVLFDARSKQKKQDDARRSEQIADLARANERRDAERRKAERAKLEQQAAVASNNQRQRAVDTR